MKLPTEVEILEVGPRDGLQNEAVCVPTQGKIELIKALVGAGIKRFEVTSFVSPKWIPQLADAEQVVQALPLVEGVVYGALVPNERGYERAKAAGIHEVALVVSATEGHCRANLNRSIVEQLQICTSIVRQSAQDGLHVRLNISTVFGCPFDGVPPLGQILNVVARVAEMGVKEITLSDTIGVANPKQISEVFAAVRREHPATRFGAHFHDTRGLALANALAALEEGVETFDSSIGGLGGCPYAPGATGNVATEDLVFMFEEMGLRTGVSIEELARATELVEGLVQRPLATRVPRNLLRKIS